jgi:hypothetical protein
MNAVSSIFVRAWQPLFGAFIQTLNLTLKQKADPDFVCAKQRSTFPMEVGLCLPY